MKIILLKSNEKLGQTGDVVEVKGGYARNYLVPSGQAVIATRSNLKAVNAQVERAKLEEAKIRANLEELMNQLNKITLEYEMKAGEDNKMFGTITNTQIADSINEKGFKVDKKEVVIPEKINVIGNHFVEIHLGHSFVAKVKLKIAAIEDEE